MAEYKEYPKEVAHRSGIKVSWNYYRTKEEADACALVAVFNAKIARSEGFDFGYCAPGMVVQREKGASFRVGFGTDRREVDVSELWEVCLP